MVMQLRKYVMNEYQVSTVIDGYQWLCVIINYYPLECGIASIQHMIQHQ